MLFDLSGRVALVTGAGQNVGAGIARMLAMQGAAVAVNDIVSERAAATAAAITDSGQRAIAAPFDVTNYDAVAAGVNAIATALGPIDILVNNAGNAGAYPMHLEQFAGTDPTAWEAPIQVNLYGVLHCCRAVISSMRERRWGRIITISSAAGTHGGGIGVASYSAGKGGGIAFTRTLALEVAATGVTANTIALGLMTMPDAKLSQQIAAGIPVGRTGTPEDVGAACVWLASTEASWVTAQTVELNGGMFST